jgi:hypothetical protein
MSRDDALDVLSAEVTEAAVDHPDKQIVAAFVEVSMDA